MSIKQDFETGEAIGSGIIYIIGVILAIGCLIGGFIAFKDFTLARKITFIAFIANSIITAIISLWLSSKNKYVKSLGIGVSKTVEKGFETNVQNVFIDTYTFIPRAVLIIYVVLYLILGLDCTLHLIFKNWTVTSFYFVPPITVILDAYLVYRFHSNKKDIESSLKLKEEIMKSPNAVQKIQVEHAQQFSEFGNVVQPKYKALPLMIYKIVTGVLFIVLTILNAINL